MQLPGALFKPKLEKKIPSEKKFLYFLIFPEMGFSGSNIKKFLYLLNRKILLYFGKPKSRKKFLIFQEKETSYISGNRHPKKLLIFQEVIFRAQKNKKIYPEKNFLYLRKRTPSKILCISGSNFSSSKK